jgi:hypothetical protein
MPFDIATGTYSEAPSVLPLDPSPATAGVTPVAAAPSPADQTPVMPYAAMFAEQRQQGEADCAAAMSAGMAAELDRRSGYQAQALPLGSHIGDDLVLPAVPTNAVPPAMSDLYPWSGQEPTPADAPGVYGGS